MVSEREAIYGKAEPDESGDAYLRIRMTRQQKEQVARMALFFDVTQSAIVMEAVRMLHADIESKKLLYNGTLRAQYPNLVRIKPSD